MSANDIGTWYYDNLKNITTLGLTWNPFRQAGFYLKDASNKALYDAFLEGTDEALQPFFFPEALKQKYIDLSLLAGSLFS